MVVVVQVLVVQEALGQHKQGLLDFGITGHKQKVKI
jgi:hypothetical protein